MLLEQSAFKYGPGPYLTSKILSSYEWSRTIYHKSRQKSHKSEGERHFKIENKHVLYGISKASQNNQEFLKHNKTILKQNMYEEINNGIQILVGPAVLELLIKRYKWFFSGTEDYDITPRWQIRKCLFVCLFVFFVCLFALLCFVLFCFLFFVFVLFCFALFCLFVCFLDANKLNIHALYPLICCSEHNNFLWCER